MVMRCRTLSELLKDRRNIICTYLPWTTSVSKPSFGLGTYPRLLECGDFLGASGLSASHILGSRYKSLKAQISLHATDSSGVWVVKKVIRYFFQGIRLFPLIAQHGWIGDNLLFALSSKFSTRLSSGSMTQTLVTTVDLSGALML